MSKIYLLQNDNFENEIDTEIARTILNKYKGYTYSEYTFKEIGKKQLSLTFDIHDYFNDIYDIIPIGDIEFVRNVMILKYNPKFIEQPIEIPTYLQTSEFLKRTYKVVKWNEIPRTGKWFLKDASKLKYLSVLTDMEFFINDEMFDYVPKTKFDASLSLPKSDDYIISTPYQIESEYRVYVINNKIVSIVNYSNTAGPLPDIKLINRAVELIKSNEEYLKSYSIDVMVGPKGTAIIEIHNFASLGLYSTTFDHNLLKAYIQGIEYYIYDNSIKYK